MTLDKDTVRFLVREVERRIVGAIVERDSAGVLIPLRVDAALENRGAGKILNILRSYESTDNGSK